MLDVFISTIQALVAYDGFKLRETSFSTKKNRQSANKFICKATSTRDIYSHMWLHSIYLFFLSIKCLRLMKYLVSVVSDLGMKQGGCNRVHICPGGTSASSPSSFALWPQPVDSPKRELTFRGMNLIINILLKRFETCHKIQSQKADESRNKCLLQSLKRTRSICYVSWKNKSLEVTSVCYSYENF